MLRALLELIVLFLIARAVWRVIGGMTAISSGVRRSSASGERQGVKLVRDPVCGTYVSPDTAVTDGRQYFCSEKCRDAFQLRAAETPRRKD